MKLNPYLHFNGNAEAAFKFYEQCLGGKITMIVRYADAPMAAQTPPAMQQQAMHIRMVIDGMELMGSDSPPDRFEKPQGFTVSLNMDDPAKADRVYNALSAGGTVHMAIQETFWAKRFAMFADKFGIPWMINCEKAPE